ncbi:hemolysin III family protein [Lentibacillus cibarius]|uniref:Hemolysin III family protein n=1 Tax=Lentibacillus cibarius TaxID=2583219 RepID=A0A549YK32_9BACI|nr:hemolysin III family protein [Lentibacillus cibarius]TRM12243.1 hemolysin III family protein [Lentibacillus cibarius]
MQIHKYSKKEEVIHAITHGIGALLSIGALILLTASTWAGNMPQLISAFIFGTTMFVMYLCSTIVHSLPNGKWKEIFVIADHSSIYLFIAGTYTPFLLLQLRGELGWKMLAIVWGIALVGIISKILFIDRFLVLSTFCYLLMGWLILFVWKPLLSTMHENGILLLIIGGLFYTIGTVFYLWRGFCYHHVIWHIFVLAGSMFHFLCIFYYVV